MDEAAWLRRRQPMGIVMPSERDAVRLSAGAREREGRLTTSAAPRVGQWPVVVAVPATGAVARDRARQSAADRTTRVGRVPPLEDEARLAS